MPDTQTIPLNVLESIGFAPNAEATSFVPKQKDMFSDFPNVFDGIKGENLNKELEDKEKTPPATVPAKTEDGGTTQAEGGKTVKNILDIGEEISKILTQTPTVPAETGEETPEEKKERTKHGTYNYLKNKIEKEGFTLWEDYDESKESIDEYLGKMTEKERQELIDENYKIRENKIKEDYRAEFFSSLPGHLKYAAKYLADETVDPRDVYAALGTIEQNRQLDPEDANDAEAICESYLQATNFGTQEEIENQVAEWKSMDVLGKKGSQFKPKLDKLAEQQLAFKLQEAERAKVEQAEAAQWYAGNVEEALRAADLGGLKITPKIQQKLYNDLIMDIRPNPRTGQPMNGLWRALDAIQFGEKPDYKHLAKITWLATDPKGYEEALIQQGRNEATSVITKQLKTTQGSGADRGQELPEQKTKKGGIPKMMNPFETRIKG